LKTIDPKQVTIGTMHQYLQASVAPRPIALVSTVDLFGKVNLSPFSFFNVMGTNPPTLVFSPNLRVRDGSSKHTLDNVKMQDEVVVHMVDYDIVEQISLSSCEYPAGVDEFVKAGFTAMPSDKVKPPRVKEAKVAFECKVKQIITLGEEGGAGNLIICEILLMHIHDSLLDEKGMINQTKTDWVARMGADWYTRANENSMFTVAKPSTHLGIGVDVIPDFIKHHPLITGNDLGRLGNSSELPSEEEVASFAAHNQNLTFEYGLELLRSNRVEDAWKVLLSYSA
jgi:flavin reductase (DIM6/NTAB) family NADH-FMN oxidoreductase RutF